MSLKFAEMKLGWVCGLITYIELGYTSKLNNEDPSHYSKWKIHISLYALGMKNFWNAWKGRFCGDDW